MPVRTVMRDRRKKVPGLAAPASRTAEGRSLAVTDHDAVAVRTVVVRALAVAAPVTECGVVVPTRVTLRATSTRLRQVDQRRSAFESGVAVCVEPVAAGTHRPDELLKCVQLRARQPASIHYDIGVAVRRIRLQL